MDILAEWAKKAGWYRTGKANFWRNSAFDEFTGLVDSYLCIIRDWRGRIHLRVHFLQDKRLTSKEIFVQLKRQRHSTGLNHVTVNQHGLTVTFGGYFQSKSYKVKKAINAVEALVPLIRSMGIRPSVVCECGRQDQLKCFKESDNALHFRCPTCAGKVEPK